MKVTEEKVWSTDAGRRLLIRKDNGEYEVPMCSADRETLADLHSAILDALIEHPISAQEQAQLLKMVEASRGKPL